MHHYIFTAFPATSLAYDFSLFFSACIFSSFYPSCCFPCQRPLDSPDAFEFPPKHAQKTRPFSFRLPTFWVLPFAFSLHFSASTSTSLPLLSSSLLTLSTTFSLSLSLSFYPSIPLSSRSPSTHTSTTIMAATKPTGDAMDVETHEQKIKSMEHSEQHYFNR